MAEFKIVKRINANTLFDAIKNEAAAEIVYVEFADKENFDGTYDKKLGFKNGR